MRSVFIPPMLLLPLLTFAAAPSFAAPPGTTSAPPDLRESFARLAAEYERDTLPLLQRFCLDCHSTQAKEGELDLERFGRFDEVRRDPSAWQKAAQMLDQNEMPPADSEQPAAEQKKRLRDWIDRYLDAESLASAGDPGPVVLRRLNNAEYGYTIHDLTGVDLDPVREFPADGASGEGFTNTGNSLVMSPALFTKYLEAAKEIAGHAVLLPEGIRFSAGQTRRDWTNEILREIRTIYLQHTSGDSDVNSLNRWDVADPRKATDDDGRVDLEKYLAALIEHRERLANNLDAVADAAASNRLNAKYLRLLAEALVSDRPSSLLLARLHDKLRSAAPADAAKLASETGAWRRQLWKFNTVGHFGSIRPWQEPTNPLSDSIALRAEAAPGPGADDVLLYLVVGDAGDGSLGDTAVWQRPRIEFKDRPAILLRDVGRLAAQIEHEVETELARTERYLAAVAALQSAPQSFDDLAKTKDLNADLLRAWTEYLGVGRTADLSIAGHFTNKISDVQGYAAIDGWGADGTPSLLANSSDETISFSTLTVPPRAVVVHPSPTQQAGVVWRSPIDGQVRVRIRVADADDKCGNGAAWAAALRRRQGELNIASGAIDNGKDSEFQSANSFEVSKGDIVSLLVNAREHNHVCDTTHVSLTIIEQGGQTWDLAGDVVGDIHAGNPHVDHYGNSDVWHFVAVADEPQRSAPEIPAGSALARWKAAALGEADRSELARLAGEVQAAVNTEASSLSDADRAVVTEITAWDGPLRWSARVKPLESSGAASQFGLDPAAFGPRDGVDVDASSFVVRGPAILEVRLPAALVRGGEFAVECALAGGEGDGSVQFQLLRERPAAAAGLVAQAPIVTHPGGPARKRLEAAFDDFRRLFPAAMCYARIVPVDEVVTLVLYHREDGHLSRLMLDDTQRQRLERLWDELHYVSRDALTSVAAFEQLMEFATQDADPRVFEPLREPIRRRAADFEQRLKETEPAHLEAIVELAPRAWRRPLSEREASELRNLYGQLRESHIPHDEAIRLVLARVLSAPAFLYRLEKSGPGAEPSEVSDWEIASRLSYFLWSSAPDEELRAAAASGRLHDPDVLAAQTRRMLRDSRTRRLAIEFACQWLHIRDFDRFDEKNERQFPGFAELRDDMYEESVLYFTDLFRNDGSVLDILDSDHTFLNEALARHYDVGDVQGEQWRRVDDVKKHFRGGVLGQATVLSSQAGASRTSPILRGNWVAETLLGERLPRPPKDVPQLPEVPTEGLTERQLIERHSTDASCAKCHARIDPYGFALEGFDAIGRLRRQDAGGRSIDTQATLPDGTRIDGVEGLRDYLAKTRRADFLRQFCRKLLGYALGRAVQLSDQPLLDEMMAQLARNDFRFSAAVETIVHSEQFRKIRGREYDVSSAAPN